MEATKNTAQKAWAFVVRHAKEHHESVNAAVGVYYPSTSATSPATSSVVSAASSRRPSDSEASSARSSMDKIWDGVKKHAKEHHRSVNGAYSAYYGPRS